MSYLVIEIQTNGEGTVGNIVSTYSDRNLAMQKYHTILAAAAVSSLASHAAVILTQEGQLLARDLFRHAQEEPEEIEN